MLNVPHTLCFCALLFCLGLNTEDVAEFGNSWAVHLAHERPCPGVDDDFPGPCSSESDMDVGLRLIFLGTV